MPMDGSQVASSMMGGGGPTMPPPSQVTSTPGQAQVGGDISKIMEALSAAVQQSVDENGYVIFQQIVSIWPQIAQQFGINVPFQTVMQLIEQNPDMLSDIAVKHGLAGIDVNGRKISAEQLAGIGSGAVQRG